MLPSSQHKRYLIHKPHILLLRAVYQRLYNLDNKLKKCHLTQFKSMYRSSSQQTAFHRKDAEMEGDGALGGRPG